MKDKGGDLEVGVGQHPPWVFFQDHRHNDVWRLGVTQHDDCAGLGRVNTHASPDVDRSVSEPQVGGLSADDLVQVSGLSRHIHG